MGSVDAQVRFTPQFLTQCVSDFSVEEKCSACFKCQLWTAVSSGDPTKWEAEAGGQFVLNQPGVYGETLFNVFVIKDLG